MSSFVSVCSGFRVGALVALAALTACGHPVQRRLEGRWIGESVEIVAPSFLVGATGWAKGTSFEFSGTRLIVTIPADEPRTGTYSVASVRDDRIVLQAKRADGTLDPVELRMQDEHSLQWILPNGGAVRFRKSD